MIFKKMKQLGAVCFLLGSIVFISGCSDIGLKLMARKHEARTESNTESDKELDSEFNEETVVKNEEAEVDELLNDQTLEKAIEEFFRELGKFIKEADQLITDKEESVNQESETGDGSNVKGKEENENLNQEQQDQQEWSDNAESSENGLISCSQVDPNNCQANSVVCAQIKAQMGSKEEIEWLEFKNACQACQNSFQKISGMTLEVIGFKEGKCPLP